MDASKEAHAPALARKAQVIILTSLPAGVTLFTLAGLWLRRDGPVGDPGPLVTVWLVGVIAALVGALVAWQRLVRPFLPVSGRHGEPPSMEVIRRFQTGQIIAMALIEGMGLFGGVILVISGRALPALTGVAMTWAALLVMWPRRGWYGLR